MNIAHITARAILDSRGNPTVEAEVILDDGTSACGAVPSGASTGQFEALELRDGDANKFSGKGVNKAVNHIRTVIAPALTGHRADDIYALDRTMAFLDGTPDKSSLGANALLAVSLASTRAAAASLQVPLYRFLGGINAVTLPVPMMNILNGGAHAANSIDTQEFMIMPIGAQSFRQGLRWCAEVFHALQTRLQKEGKSTGVGDEGGFSPDLTSDEDAIEHILCAIQMAGYTPYQDFVLALDAAASEWKHPKGKGYYRQPKSGKEFSTEELITYWKNLTHRYPIASIEDGLDEEDWPGWQQMTRLLGHHVQLVGDDLFVTNEQRLQKGFAEECANAVLIKPNQIGTLSETLNAIRTAQQAGFSTIISHRSGETEDTSIADLAVAFNTGQIKTGAPCRGERVAKYNRLLRIEEELGSASIYAGRGVLQAAP